MPSKTLWFNRGLFVQCMRNVGWVSLAYLLCLLFIMPLQILMEFSKDDYNRYIRHFEQVDTFNLFNAVNGELQVLFMVVFPVLLAVFLFRYMHVKLSSDFTHSLPLKREHLFVQHTVYGLLILIAPVLITGIVLYVLGFILGISHVLTLSCLLAWAAQTILFNTFIFMAGVFVAVFTGISVLHGALVYILLFFPFGIFTLIFANLSFYLFGLTPSYYMNANMEQLVPFVRAFDLGYNPLTVWETFTYLLIAVVAFVIALLVYRKRHAEMATQAVAVRPLRPVFVYGVAFCTMLLGGVYFGETQNESLSWIIFGYVTASILGYYIAQMILEKTWRVFNKWRGYLLFVAGVLLLGLCVHFDITGFEKRVPETSNIESIYLNSYYDVRTDSKHAVVYYDNELERKPWIDSMGLPFGKELYHYRDPQVIELLRELHLQVVEDQEVLEHQKLNDQYDRYARYRTVSLAYNLKNGGKLVRHYEIPNDRYIDILKPIYESREYKTNFYPLLRIDDLSNLDSITFNNPNIDKRLTISDPQKLQELHQTLQEELSNEAAEELLQSGASFADIQYNWDNGRNSYAQWKLSYKKLEQLLIQYGVDQEIRTTADDIKYMLIAKIPDESMSVAEASSQNATIEIHTSESIGLDPRDYLPYDFRYTESIVKITDPAIFAECLPLINSGNLKQTDDYMVALYFKNSNYVFFYVDQQQLPQSVQELVDTQ